MSRASSHASISIATEKAHFLVSCQYRRISAGHWMSDCRWDIVIDALLPWIQPNVDIGVSHSKMQSAWRLSLSLIQSHWPLMLWRLVICTAESSTRSGETIMVLLKCLPVWEGTKEERHFPGPETSPCPKPDPPTYQNSGQSLTNPTILNWSNSTWNFIGFKFGFYHNSSCTVFQLDPHPKGLWTW